MRRLVRILSLIILSVIMLFPLYKAEAASDSYGSIIEIWDDIYVGNDNSVDGDVVSVFGTIEVDGDVSGSVVSIFGNITINGKVLGDTVAVFGNINKGDNGEVLGSTVEALGGRYPANVSKYYYNYEYRPGFHFNPLGKVAGSVFSLILSTVLFIISAFIYLIIPSRLSEMADTIDSNIGKRFGIGFLSLICTPVAMVLLTIVLAITIIGAIIIPFAWMAYLAAGIVSLIPVYIYTGLKIGYAASNKKMTALGALAVGIYSIWLVQTIISLGGGFTIWINTLMSFAAFLLGTGTLIDYIMTLRRRKEAYPPVSDPQFINNHKNNQNPS